MIHNSYKALAALVLAGSLSLPAEAQFKHIDKSQLPMADQIERSRLKIRVRNEQPEVKYDQPPQAQPVYLIPTGLPSAAPPSVVVMPGAPSGSGQGTVSGGNRGIVVPPGYAVVDPNNPAPARFETNIPRGGPRKPTGLPSGITTGVHSLQLNGVLRPGQPAAQARPVVPAAVIPAVSTYRSYPTQATGSGQGGAQMRVQTQVEAKLKRGELLKR